MKVLRVLPFCIFLTVFLASTPDAQSGCISSALKNLTDPIPKIEHLTQDVDFIYYPTALHVELGANNMAWSTLLGYSENVTVDQLIRKANTGGKPFFKIQIRKDQLVDELIDACGVS